jgi:hypothetical protein
MDQETKDSIAQDKFSKNFNELDSDEKMSVGGSYGRKKGGDVRKEQMSEQGTTEDGKMKGYSEMGSTGAKKGGYSTGYAHDPKEQEKYTGRSADDE